MPDEDIGLSVSIENIVMEGSRRLEEWNRIKKKIPSMEIVFKMATAPGEGTFEISLKPVEWNLLLLVDGTRSVAELASDTNRTDFEVSRVLYGLFSAGLLEVASDEEVEKLRGRARAARGARRRAGAREMAGAPRRPRGPAACRQPAGDMRRSRAPRSQPAAGEAGSAAAEHEVPTFLTRHGGRVRLGRGHGGVRGDDGRRPAGARRSRPRLPFRQSPRRRCSRSRAPEPERSREPSRARAAARGRRGTPSIEIAVTDRDEPDRVPVEEFELSASDFFTAPEEAVPAPAVEAARVVEQPPVRAPAEPEPRPRRGAARRLPPSRSFRSRPR